MEEIKIDDNLDKECNALGALFQHIVDETKAGIPNIEELIVKAGKLNSSLKGTILTLGSFLDTFQKIADSASNTKGGSRDIGTCLTRIVIRHRALESRMKTLSGALMDCLVLPIQNKLEEWKKITHHLDKEHAKEYKKYRSHIKKKSEAVSRLRKKSKKDIRGSGVNDPSVLRLIEQTSRDLNGHYQQLFDHEKICLRRIMTEERHRYCNLVASLKPIIDEELGMLSELASVEDVMQKLGNVTSNTDEIITDEFIDDAAHQGGLVYATPPATPSPSMGSRKSSMCSIASLASTSSLSQQPLSPSRSSTTSSLRRHTSYRESYNGSDNNNSRPNSALSSAYMANKNVCWMDEKTQRPHTISSAFEKNGAVHQRPPINGHTFSKEVLQTNSEPVSPAKFNGIQSDLTTYSTIRRSYRSPFRTSSSAGGYNRPPLPTRCSSADRSSSGSLISMQRSTSVERSLSGKPPIPTHSNSVHVIGFNDNSKADKIALVSPTHYAVPKTAAKIRIQLVPDFHQGKQDMVIPQPVYMNSEELRLQKGDSDDLKDNDDDLKTPTIEELTFPGQQVVNEDGSSSSSGSSSGYGSQNAIKIEDKNGMPPSVPNVKLSPNRNGPPIFHRSISAHNNNSQKPPPPPPIRRSSSITSQDSLSSRTSTFRSQTAAATSPMSNDDEDVTPHGSMENVNSPTQDRLSLEAMVAKASNVASNLITLNGGDSTMRRSTSLSTKSAVESSAETPKQNFDRDQFLRRSLTLTSKTDRANLIHTLTERISQRMQQNNHVTVIPVKSGAGATSPEGEKYGFGAKFKHSSKAYFDMSASYPNAGSMTNENKKFIDNLSSKLRVEPKIPEKNPNNYV